MLRSIEPLETMIFSMLNLIEDWFEYTSLGYTQLFQADFLIVMNVKFNRSGRCGWGPTFRQSSTLFTHWCCLIFFFFAVQSNAKHGTETFIRKNINYSTQNFVNLHRTSLNSVSLFPWKLFRRHYIPLFLLVLTFIVKTRQDLYTVANNPNFVSYSIWLYVSST